MEKDHFSDGIQDSGCDRSFTAALDTHACEWVFLRTFANSEMLQDLQDTGNNEDLLQEIESLRADLRKRDQEIAHLKAQNQKLANTLDEREAAGNLHAAEHNL